MIWRKQDGTPIAGLMDTVESRGEDGLTVLPLNMLGKVILGHAEKEPLIEILWEHKVVDVGQDEGSAWADVELKDGERKRVKGDYLSGCDGANSRVRKSLFGDEFKGKTWDAQIVATNVFLPFPFPQFPSGSEVLIDSLGILSSP
jgi:2-polyprenyl-6-methoxyphenol hydroxylase-like FAD-dependent oxidoreductase